METFQEIFDNKSAFRLKEDFDDGYATRVNKQDIKSYYDRLKLVKVTDVNGKKLNDKNKPDFNELSDIGDIITDNDTDKIIGYEFNVDDKWYFLKEQALKENRIKEESEIQSVVFEKEYWTKTEAIKWLKDHDMKTDIDEKQSSYRARQESPNKFDKFRYSDEKKPGLKFDFGIK
jgi:hypothetical protein